MAERPADYDLAVETRRFCALLRASAALMHRLIRDGRANVTQSLAAIEHATNQMKQNSPARFDD